MALAFLGPGKCNVVEFHPSMSLSKYDLKQLKYIQQQHDTLVSTSSPTE